jgi:hypothetical protein
MKHITTNTENKEGETNVQTTQQLLHLQFHRLQNISKKDVNNGKTTINCVFLCIRILASTFNYK